MIPAWSELWTVAHSRTLQACTTAQDEQPCTSVTLVLVPARVSPLAKNFGVRRSRCRVMAFSWDEILSLEPASKRCPAPAAISAAEAARLLGIPQGELRGQCSALSPTDPLILWDVLAAQQGTYFKHGGAAGAEHVRVLLRRPDPP